VTALCRAGRLQIVQPSSSTKSLAEKMGCSLVTAAVLESRGGTEKDRDHFLGLDPVPEKSLIDCLDLGSGAPEAAERWKRLPALGKVLVYGDYDVDGVSSTTLAKKPGWCAISYPTAMTRGTAFTNRFSGNSFPWGGIPFLWWTAARKIQGSFQWLRMQG